jgi:hypothetical protein
VQGTRTEVELGFRYEILIPIRKEGSEAMSRYPSANEEV